ncbi:MAG: hypothetical protein ACI976_001996 [Aureispira sp.]|jgi:hypothetical protein
MMAAIFKIAGIVLFCKSKNDKTVNNSIELFTVLSKGSKVPSIY